MAVCSTRQIIVTNKIQYLCLFLSLSTLLFCRSFSQFGRRFDDNAFRFNWIDCICRNQSKQLPCLWKCYFLSALSLVENCEHFVRNLHYFFERQFYPAEFCVFFCFRFDWNCSRQSTRFIIVLFACFRYGSYSRIVQRSLPHSLDNGFQLWNHDKWTRTLQLYWFCNKCSALNFIAKNGFN